MESSEEETDSCSLQKAYSFTDLLDELDTEDTSESLTSPTSPTPVLPVSCTTTNTAISTINGDKFTKDKEIENTQVKKDQTSNGHEKVHIDQQEVVKEVCDKDSTISSDQVNGNSVETRDDDNIPHTEEATKEDQVKTADNKEKVETEVSVGDQEKVETGVSVGDQEKVETEVSESKMRDINILDKEGVIVCAKEDPDNKDKMVEITTEEEIDSSPEKCLKTDPQKDSEETKDEVFEKVDEDSEKMKSDELKVSSQDDVAGPKETEPKDDIHDHSKTLNETQVTDKEKEDKVSEDSSKIDEEKEKEKTDSPRNSTPESSPEKTEEEKEKKNDTEKEKEAPKKDTVWKRKKVIKKRKKKNSIDSQSSTSSTTIESEESNSGSFDGENSRVYKPIGPNTENRVGVSCDNPIYVSDITATDSTNKDDGYEPIEFRAQLNNKKDGGDIYENVPNSELFDFVARKNDPKRCTLRRGSTLREMGSSETLELAYRDSQKVVKVLPDDELQELGEQEVGVWPGRTLDKEGIYESIALPAPLSPLTPSAGTHHNEDEDYDDYSWGSSEFESYDEDDDSQPLVGSKEPISVTVQVKSHQEPSSQNVLNKLAARIGPRSRSRSEDTEDANTYLEVTLNMEKHPPPQLPPPPPNLTPAQTKRRLIVASIVESECSYTKSLRRIIEDYQKPLLLAKPQIISKNSIRTIFFRISDILQCHNMFHIELAEYIRVWDTEEKVGNVFTASFSKSMVFDVYSEFVNNFTIAMESAKKLAKQKQAFSDFLKTKIQESTDKLSLFGLMVKPIQRFPQFILCLQDLLKHTSQEHHDRLALQLALTELETLTHKLNEMKRESENRHEVKKIISSMTGRFSLKHDTHRCMVRQDDMVQLDCTPGSNKNKPRRLFMMSDQLVCATAVQKDGDTGLAEKFKFKWSIPIRDVDVLEVEVPDLYHVKGGPGRSMIVAPKLDQSTFSPWKKELDDMMHDLAIIEQISNLTSQLRLNYQVLSTDLIFSIQRGLQLAIQDQGDVDKCILNLSLPTKLLQTSRDKLKEEMSKHIPHKTKVKGSRATKMLHTFHVQSATIKQDWLLELKNAKLALDPNNRPGWYVPETDQAMCVRLPLFVKPLLIDITKQETKIQCAIPVMFPCTTNPFVGVQHLWVCSNESNRGQVTVVLLHSSQPHVLESFTACDAPIICAEFVPGLAAYDQKHAFPQDTVWMAMESNELCVRSVVEENRDVDPLLVLDTDDRVTCLRFLDGCLYVGLETGQLAIYIRDRDGVWQIEDRLLVDIGDGPVNSLLSLNHEMWVACGNKVHIVSMVSSWRGGLIHHHVQQSEHEVGGEGEEVTCMVKAGVGLMVSFRGQGVIRIFNQETFLHLQDINVASSVAHILEGKDLGDQNIDVKKVNITSMLASKGLLWIGTCCGCTLTLPLPRLEGVPQIKGRPSVSYHAHLGPIKFITPIHCGTSQLQLPGSAPPSANQSRIFHLDRDGDPGSRSELGNDSISERGTPSFVLDGATESDTNDDPEEVLVHDEEMEDPRNDFISRLVRHRGQSEYLSTSMLNINQMGTIEKTKWLSTPDLRHGSVANLTDSEEDVMNLYNNLLSSTDYEHYDFELMGGKKKRRLSSELASPGVPLTEEPFRFAPGRGPSVHHRRSSKYATLPLPALMEDCPVYNMDEEPAQLDPSNNTDYTDPSNSSESPQSSSLRSSMYSPEESLPETPSINTPRPPSSSRNTPRTRHYTMNSTSNHVNKNTSRSVVIVSGGEGHINWADKNAGDNKYDDICLLLWQCRV